MCFPVRRTKIDELHANPTQQNSYRTINNRWEVGVSWIGLIIVGGAAFWLFFVGDPHTTQWKKVYGAWTIGVPVMFFFHYVFFGEHFPTFADRLEHIRHLQQIGLNIWVALAALLAVLWMPR